MKTTTALSLTTLFSFISCASIFISGCEKREVVQEQIKEEYEKAKKNQKAVDDHDHGHGHGHDHTPHMGIVVPVWMGQTKAAYAELKLHDDKGDLELWLTVGEDGAQPFDLALESVITVSFPELDNKSVKLKVRNSDKNEDENGQANIRGSKTNYFIFPGDTGVDASFLIGKEFTSKVTISFADGEKRYATDQFVLEPHTH